MRNRESTMLTSGSGEPVISVRAGDVSGLLRADWQGIRFALRYEIDAAEHARRTQLAVGAVDDAGILATVLALPVGKIGPVVCSGSVDVDDVLASGLARLVVDLDGEVWGNRIGVVPLRPVEAIVPARTLSTGMVRAERLAGYSPRSILLPARSQPSEELLSECGVYGLGVYLADPMGVQTLVECAPMRVQRCSAEWWEFLETMYRGHLAGDDVVDQRSSMSQFRRSAAATYFGR
jgi:hypothetical protein